MEKRKNFISVVIPAYNEEKTLPIIIDSLRGQSEKNFEIIVVNNNSTDNTYKVAKRLADKVYNCKEQGISPARNFGSKKAKGNILAFIDSDCVPSNNWIKSINEGFSEDSVVATSGLILHDFKNPFKKLYINSIFYFQYLYSKLASNFGKFILTSPNIAIRKDIFFRIGGFKKIICEDIYLGRELSKLPNIKIRIINKMSIYCSTRRLDKVGFFKTLNYWAFAHYKNIDASNYALDYIKK